MIFFIFIILLVIVFLYFYKKTKKLNFNIEIKTTYKYPVKGWENIVHKNIGMENKICPYCGNILEKFPSRKKQCKACKNYMYIRTRPYDNKKVIVTEQEIEIIKEDELKKYGEYEEYLIQKQKFEQEKDWLKKIRNCNYVPNEDVQWSLYNKDRLLLFSQQNWKEYMEITSKMAQQLYIEKKYDDSLELYLEAGYFDICSPDENGAFENREAILGYPHCSYIINLIQCMEKAGLEIEDVEKMFYNVPISNIKIPISRKEAWEIIDKNIRNLQKEQLKYKN